MIFCSDVLLFIGLLVLFSSSVCDCSLIPSRSNTLLAALQDGFTKFRSCSIPGILPPDETFRKVLAGSVASLVVSSTALAIPCDAAGVAALGRTESQIIQLFERNTPSVVFINTFVERIDALSMNIVELPAGTGSGFVWDTEGHIVTNYHVIRNAKSAKVTVTDQYGKSSRTYDATVTGVDPDKDVAVLCVDNKHSAPWKPIAVGSSSTLRVGQFALAIGNPFGLDHTLTTGVVSGLGRQVRSPSNKPISNVIQTDAAISPGNSGGPLLDSAGRLIGMNTAIYSPSGSSAGIGFAIPVDTLKYEVDTLIRDGMVVRPVLGIAYMDSSQAGLLGVSKGILVLNAPDGSPAAVAGIRSTQRGPQGNIVLGDIIVGMDADDIANENDLFRAIEKHRVGDVVNVRVLRQTNPSSSAAGSESDAVLVTVPVQLSSIASTST